MVRLDLKMWLPPMIDNLSDSLDLGDLLLLFGAHEVC